jgi:hypothetical protein
MESDDEAMETMDNGSLDVQDDGLQEHEQEHAAISRSRQFAELIAGGGVPRERATRADYLAMVSGDVLEGEETALELETSVLSSKATQKNLALLLVKVVNPRGKKRLRCLLCGTLLQLQATCASNISRHMRTRHSDMWTSLTTEAGEGCASLLVYGWD